MQPRLFSLQEASTYTGLSYWSVRDLVMAGHLPSVRLPAPRARDGRNMRRILIDKEDLDALIERWKECDPV